ncbi:hypothetical protein BDR04DRAFT_1163618 [Suillus decipiens]|nr:hypothetical protein BDR04DRAFT_1163618 [Suillus decipiens]
MIPIRNTRNPTMGPTHRATVEFVEVGTNSVPTLTPSATYVPPNVTKPKVNSTSVASNSPTYAGSLTYSPPTTGMGTPPPLELGQRSSDIPRPSSTGVGTPSGIDASQSFSSFLQPCASNCILP